MPDVLIRDFPAEDLTLLESQARQLGLSRAEYLRRELQQVARRAGVAVTTRDLVELSDLISDLGDESVIAQAWS